MPEAFHFDILVVGAGPAGIEAAIAAASTGASVGIVDENPQPGGQIYRAKVGKLAPEVAKRIQGIETRGVKVLRSVTIFDAPEPGILIGATQNAVISLSYQKLILAVGARELFLPFPGWTLPNVMGVGGLQALVKSGLNVRGKRVVVAGSGPLLIAVGSYLKDYGAEVMAIVEQASTANLARFAAGMAKYPSKIKQGAPLILGVGRLIQRGAWVESASGKDKLESVKLNKSIGNIQCDYLACSFGFVPNLELPMLLGCQVVNGFVKVDRSQATSVPGIFCVGEPTGIGGLELSVVEGKVAGFSAIGKPDLAKELMLEKQKWQAFARELDQTFALRDELKSLVKPETVVCRCEDVRHSQLMGYDESRSAKLHTRCGMGPCQGRICGASTRFLYGWEHGSVRPPLIPVPLTGLVNGDSSISKTPN